MPMTHVTMRRAGKIDRFESEVVVRISNIIQYVVKSLSTKGLTCSFYNRYMYHIVSTKSIIDKPSSS